MKWKVFVALPSKSKWVGFKKVSMNLGFESPSLWKLLKYSSNGFAPGWSEYTSAPPRSCSGLVTMHSVATHSVTMHSVTMHSVATLSFILKAPAPG